MAEEIRPRNNDRTPERRLRIGYVSPDFNLHPVGQFMLPLLKAHDRQEFEIHCYSAVTKPDVVTESCRAAADGWHDIAQKADGEVAEMVRRDAIDILVDLAMHTNNTRLLIFARKPAPVQVTYLAYCGTTGLSAIDYRLTDPYSDTEENRRSYPEESIVLPETFWCYQPIIEAPEVGPLPCIAAGHITFGCFNTPAKLSPTTLETWIKVLQAVPNSRLVLLVFSKSHQERIQTCFADQGVARTRISFVQRGPLYDYFMNHQQIDIALDPFPYGGGATTCDALWMGVPVVTLAGKTGVGRGGLSILSNIGLANLVASDRDEYVEVAAALASDRARLIKLRGELRRRMQASPLMDAPRFARNVEAAYRKMWHRYCRQ